MQCRIAPKISQLGLAFLAAVSPLAVAAQDIQFRDGRFLETIGSVTIQRADDASSDEAVRNMPFLPGDRVWTDDGARAEIVFANGEILWMAERSKVDSLGRGGREQDERLGLRVYSGSLGIRVRDGGPGFELQVAGGVITTTGESAFRVDVRSGETTISVSEGAVLANLGAERMSLRSGERARFANGRAEAPYRYQRMTNDAFDRWCLERWEELGRLAAENTGGRLPGEIAQYESELDRNGEWVYDEPQGYVYVPRVAADWSPYTYGRWVYTLYGWTWVDDQPWGFVTSHYGRWGYSSRVGWHWLPRLGFSGAWVSWSTPIGARWNNTIGWCALGFNDRAISSYSFSSSSYARNNDRRTQGRGWSWANRSDLGRGNIARRRIDIPVEDAARAVVWNANNAPDREFRETRRHSDERAVSRSGGERSVRVGEGRGGRDDAARIYVRPSPGDSTPELRSDPATTIPNPEARRRPAIGQDGFKEDQDSRNRSRRGDGGFVGVYQSGGGGAGVAGESGRDRQATHEQKPEPAGVGAVSRAGARDESARKPEETERPGRDPLLNRFFRSITRPNATEGDTASRSDDASAKRRDPQNREPEAREPRTRDDSSARDDAQRGRQSQPASSSNDGRARSRPSGGEDRERARPSGGDRAQPRSSTPPPQRSGGSSGSSNGNGGAKRRPHNN